jgi:hypothetical protein
MKSRKVFVLLSLVVLLVAVGCATVPSGPSVLVLPAPGKPFEQFRSEDALCQQYARQSIGLSPQETVNKNTATGAAVGTAIGAGLGAAIGAASGNAGSGAAIGAGTGLLIGTAEGSSAGQYYGQEAQRRYDNAYIQCMYAQGNAIPGMRVHRVRGTPPPPPDMTGPILNESYLPAPSARAPKPAPTPPSSMP